MDAAAGLPRSDRTRRVRVIPRPVETPSSPDPAAGKTLGDTTLIKKTRYHPACAVIHNCFPNVCFPLFPRLLGHVTSTFSAARFMSLVVQVMTGAVPEGSCGQSGSY